MPPVRPQLNSIADSRASFHESVLVVRLPLTAWQGSQHRCRDTEQNSCYHIAAETGCLRVMPRQTHWVFQLSIKRLQPGELLTCSNTTPPTLGRYEGNEKGNSITQTYKQ
ncbi:hypothetical protein CesoFtcFv8_010187 [Champsocephalus esox]|uniref:Uncharacterized protein n=1 Tax=Champsocephalus esox TaxID=159716 RepID=A0AAN8GYY0_9TELE|nr:hypothetical protein CesoFtcFv8_010187 [Champsocephalus esox]